jgi:hypothetical protein
MSPRGLPQGFLQKLAAVAVVGGGFKQKRKGNYKNRKIKNKSVPFVPFIVVVFVVVTDY